MGPPHEGSILRSIAPRPGRSTTELHLAPYINNLLQTHSDWEPEPGCELTTQHMQHRAHFHPPMNKAGTVMFKKESTQVCG